MNLSRKMISVLIDISQTQQATIGDFNRNTLAALYKRGLIGCDLLDDSRSYVVSPFSPSPRVWLTKNGQDIAKAEKAKKKIAWERERASYKTKNLVSIQLESFDMNKTQMKFDRWRFKGFERLYSPEKIQEILESVGLKSLSGQYPSILVARDALNQVMYVWGCSDFSSEPLCTHLYKNILCLVDGDEIVIWQDGKNLRLSLTDVGVEEIDPNNFDMNMIYDFFYGGVTSVGNNSHFEYEVDSEMLTDTVENRPCIHTCQLDEQGFGYEVLPNDEIWFWSDDTELSLIEHLYKHKTATFTKGVFYG